MSINSFPKAVFSNFITSLRTALFLPIHNRPAFFVTAPHFLVALLFSFSCAMVLWAYWLWPVDTFSIYGLASYLGRSAWFYFWIAAILSVFGLSNRFSRLAITLCYATPLGLLAGVIMTSAFQMGYIPSSLGIVAIYGASYLFYATSISRVIWASANAARWKAIPIAGLVIAASITGSFVADNAPLFEKNYEQTASNEVEDTYKPVSAEAIYYAQSSLMAGETAQLHTQTKGVRDTYAILGAGYAEQSVFLSEVTAVKQLFADTYGANSSTITLANSRPHPTQHPLLNPINLRNAVDTAAQKMDLEEDTLVLFLTSHGSPRTDCRLFLRAEPLTNLLI